jgi:hypothetical protein
MTHLTNIKSNLIGRAYIYAEKNILDKKDRDMFLKGVKFAINRTDIKWKL